MSLDEKVKKELKKKETRRIFEKIDKMETEERHAYLNAYHDALSYAVKLTENKDLYKYKP